MIREIPGTRAGTFFPSIFRPVPTLLFISILLPSFNKVALRADGGFLIRAILYIRNVKKLRIIGILKRLNRNVKKVRI